MATKESKASATTKSYGNTRTREKGRVKAGHAINKCNQTREREVGTKAIDYPGNIYFLLKRSNNHTKLVYRCCTIVYLPTTGTTKA